MSKFLQKLMNEMEEQELKMIRAAKKQSDHSEVSVAFRKLIKVNNISIDQPAKEINKQLKELKRNKELISL